MPFHLSFRMYINIAYSLLVAGHKWHNNRLYHKATMGCGIKAYNINRVTSVVPSNNNNNIKIWKVWYKIKEDTHAQVFQTVLKFSYTENPILKPASTFVIIRTSHQTMPRPIHLSPLNNKDRSTITYLLD
jgi:hypothetical protein